MNQLLLPRQQTKLLIKTALWVAKIIINKLLQIEINYKVTTVQSIYKGVKGITHTLKFGLSEKHTKICANFLMH